MINKRYDELKPGDVFKLSNDRTYVLVAEVWVPASGGTKVRVNGYRGADPANGVHSFSTSYLADREVTVCTYEEVVSPAERLAHWGASFGGDSYTFAGESEPV